MLKERLKATLEKVRAIICMALPCSKKESKVITVGNNNADIDINKYNSFNDAIPDAFLRLKNGGTIRLQPENYQINSILHDKEHIYKRLTIRRKRKGKNCMRELRSEHILSFCRCQQNDKHAKRSSTRIYLVIASRPWEML